jgi:hypothetical protein
LFDSLALIGQQNCVQVKPGRFVLDAISHAGQFFVCDIGNENRKPAALARLIGIGHQNALEVAWIVITPTGLKLQIVNLFDKVLHELDAAIGKRPHLSLALVDDRRPILGEHQLGERIGRQT